MPLIATSLVLISTFLHAGWNLLVGSQRTSYTLLRIILIITVVGLGPALAAEFWGTPLPTEVWKYAVLAGIFLTVYYFGLAKGYQNGHFTVVYPVARALPILLVAIIDVARGHAPSSLAWVGMILVSLGCIMMPLKSLRSFKLSDYWNLAMIWIIVTALGTVGYSTVDNAAAELVPPGPTMAARYGIYEFTFSSLFYWLLLKALRQPTGDANGWRGWKVPALGAVGLFGAYWLILWSFQISPQASYVVALRQFSIVIGVAAGVFLFHEPSPGLRISAAVTIAVGIAFIALGG